MKQEIQSIIDNVETGMDRINTASSMNYTSNYTDLNSFIEVFAENRPELEKKCGFNAYEAPAETMLEKLQELCDQYPDYQWAFRLFEAGYDYTSQGSFEKALDHLTSAALHENAPSSLKILTVRMYQMLDRVAPDELSADEGLHLKDEDLERLQQEVNQYRDQHGKWPETLETILTDSDREMISRLLLPLTIDPSTGEVITQELLRRRYIGGTRQQHMNHVERYQFEDFEEPAD